MTSGAVFDRVLVHLPTDRYRFVVPDLPGAGGSPDLPEPHGIKAFSDAVWDVADAMALTRPAIVGHSMGGLIAQVMAADRPADVPTLILINPVPASGVPLPNDARAMFGSAADNRDVLGAILDMACHELAPADREHLLDVAVGVTERGITEGFAAWADAAFTGRLASIAARTEVVATSDPFLPPAFLQQTVVDLIGGARLHELPGPGHYPLVERPAETAALLTALLDG